MKARVVNVEVIVVLCQRDKVLRPGGDVQIHQLFRLPALGLPCAIQFDRTELRGMPVVGDVKLVLG